MGEKNESLCSNTVHRIAYQKAVYVEVFKLYHQTLRMEYYLFQATNQINYKIS